MLPTTKICWLPHDGLEDLAHLLRVGELAVQQPGDVGQADVLLGQLFVGQHAHAAGALDAVAFESVVHFGQAVVFGELAELILGALGTAAEKSVLLVGHGLSLM